MRICLLADSRSIHTHRWVEHFVDRGHEVHLVTKGQLNNHNIKNIHLYSLKEISTNMPFISYYLNLFYCVIQVKKIINDIDADILHSHYVSNYGIIGALTGFHPFVLSVWGSDILKDPQASNRTKRLVSFALKRAEMTTTTAEFMKGHLMKSFDLNESKILRIPWGIDLNIFHRGYEKETKALKEELGIESIAPIILSNRSMHPNYEVESIIEAIPSILVSDPKTRFIFMRGYGSLEYEYEMKLKVRKLGIQDNVIFISENVTPSNMAIYLNLADIFISIPKTDQFASSIMEGMACGAIPIVSNRKVYKQYLVDGNNAFFVDPEDPEDIAQKVVYCIEHILLKDIVYDINLKIIEEKENWERNAGKMEELYESLLIKEG